MATDGIVGGGPWEWLFSIPILGSVFGAMYRLRGKSARDIALVRDRLAAFEVEVAEQRATNGYVKEVEDRSRAERMAMEVRIREDLRGIAERLDRLLERANGNGRK